MTLLAHGGNVAANATEELSSQLTSKAARHLLLDLDHTNITLGLAIVKRNAQMMQESKNLVLMLVQTIEQTACRMLAL